MPNDETKKKLFYCEVFDKRFVDVCDVSIDFRKKSLEAISATQQLFVFFFRLLGTQSEINAYFQAHHSVLIACNNLKCNTLFIFSYLLCKYIKMQIDQDELNNLILFLNVDKLTLPYE